MAKSKKRSSPERQKNELLNAQRVLYAILDEHISFKSQYVKKSKEVVIYLEAINMLKKHQGKIDKFLKTDNSYKS